MGYSSRSLKEPDTTEQLSIQKDKVMLIENENLGPWNESIGVYTFDYISSTFHWSGMSLQFSLIKL